MSESLIRVIITRNLASGNYSVKIMKDQSNVTNFKTLTRWGARRKADRFLKTRGKYTHAVKYDENY